MIKRMGHWFGKGEKEIRTRLSADEALAIARAATSGDAMGEDLGPATVQDRSGTPVWIVSSATVGQMLEVTIDDTSGKVLEIKRVGVR